MGNRTLSAFLKMEEHWAEELKKFDNPNYKLVNSSESRPATKTEVKLSKCSCLRLGVTRSNPNRHIFLMPEPLDYLANVTYLVTGTLVDVVY